MYLQERKKNTLKKKSNASYEKFVSTETALYSNINSVEKINKIINYCVYSSSIYK